MGLIKFNVLFDRTTPAYYPNETVSGRVIVAVDKPKKTEGVFLKLEGKGFTHWVERNESLDKSDRQQRDSEDYMAEEVYFTMQTCIGGNDGVIPAGEHGFPFAFPLPSALPSSFEGTYGNVRYTARAKIVRSWRFDHVVKEPFTVNSLVDLNSNPTNKMAPTVETDKNLGCWCCKSRPILLKVTLNKSGFVPGESIVIDAEVTNNSNQRMSSVAASLQQTVRYVTPRKSKVDVRELVELKKNGLEAGQKQVWEKETMVVPPLPPTGLGGFSAVIQVTYDFHMLVSTPFYTTNLYLSIPVTIGTVPLMDNVSGSPYSTPEAATTLYPGEPFGWNNPALMAGHPPSHTPYQPSAPHVIYPLLPPSNYQACMFGAQDIREQGDNQYEGGTKQFAPMYPIFKPT